LSTGYRASVAYGDFIKGDIADHSVLDHVYNQYNVDAVMHFASFIEVGETVISPEKYYQNNFINTLNLLNTMIRNDVKCFIFSSTAAVFGEPEYTNG
jgi:UDP-glucose 4-epimerase